MWEYRNYEDRNDALDLELNPNRSQPTEISEVSRTPGSVVWAKTHDQIGKIQILKVSKRGNIVTFYKNCSNFLQTFYIFFFAHSERDNSSSSGRARSKRERKPKVHFDVS